MAKCRLLIFTLVAYAFVAVSAAAQQTNALQPSELQEYKERVRGLTMFFQFMLNTVGDESTPVKEREIIITESYAKIFRDSEVQIEDDLLADRQAITNKPVTAYLRDVDFFFTHAQFQFDILDILTENHEDGGIYFKVVLDRHLTALSVDEGKIKNTQKRFIEINLDRSKDDLKIVSIYTTKMSRDEELQNWWNSLSFQWTSIFMNKFGIDGEVEMPTLYRILDLDSLDLSNNPYLVDLKPVELLSKLKYIDFSGTRVADIAPLRGLTQLQHLNAGRTLVSDLGFLRFCRQLEVLNLSQTNLDSFDEWQNFSQLQQLDLSGSNYSNFEFLTGLPQLSALKLPGSTAFYDILVLRKSSNLQQLDLSGTGVNSLNGIAVLPKLREIDLSSTKVGDLSPLVAMKTLEVVAINNSPVNDIAPLAGMPQLKKIFADNSGITQEVASTFMTQNPKILVIVNARENEQWWGGLSIEWQAILKPYIGQETNTMPNAESLARLFNIDSLNLNAKLIADTKPLTRFQQLRVLDISHTQIKSLEFTKKLTQLRELAMSGLGISDLSPLAHASQLRSLTADQNAIRVVGPLLPLVGLSYLNIDQNNVSRDEVRKLVSANPNCEVIFDTSGLVDWWESLDEGWKKSFRPLMGNTKSADSRALHQLVSKPSISLSGQHINALWPLDAFIYLRELQLESTAITHFADLPGQDFLESLSCTKSPLSDITALAKFRALRHLNISDTPVDKLAPLIALYNLETLNISGTNLKNLKGMEALTALKSFDCSNTSIKNLSPLTQLPALRNLSCFNTGIKDKQLQEFKAAQPKCEVVYY